MVNDHQCLRPPGALSKPSRPPAVGVCLMHMQGGRRHEPGEPRLDDVVGRGPRFSRRARRRGRARASSRERIVIDPARFRKTVPTFELPRNLHRLADRGLPGDGGWSRKSTLGRDHGPRGRRALAGRSPRLCWRYSRGYNRSACTRGGRRGTLLRVAAMDGLGGRENDEQEVFRTDGVRGKVGPSNYRIRHAARFCCGEVL